MFILKSTAVSFALSILFLISVPSSAHSENMMSYNNIYSKSSIMNVSSVVRLRLKKYHVKSDFANEKDSEFIKKKIKSDDLPFPLFTTYVAVMGNGNYVPIKDAIKIVLEKVNKSPDLANGKKLIVINSQFTYSIYGEINGLMLFVGN